MTALAHALEVSKRFGDNQAVRRVGLAVSPGEIVGLLGANGAGKTTFIKMLLGILRPDEGVVTLFDSPPTRETRRRIGYLPQTLGLYDDLTVAENLRFTAAVFGIDAPPLGDLAPVGDTIVAELPLGIRRRAGFLAALSHRPDLLVLDEPTSGVGPVARAELWETIHDAADDGAGIVVSTHYMDEAEQCDRLLFLSTGREIASGTIDQIVAGHTVIEALPADRAAAITALEGADLPVVPVGSHLRVPGATLEQVNNILGDHVAMTATDASLEEVFITLVRGL